MRKLILMTCTALLIAASTKAYAAPQRKAIVGAWKYEASMAPEGYRSGILLFSENDGNITGKLQLDGDYTINLQQLTFENNELQFSLYIDGYYISGNAKIEDDELQGTADTPDGALAFTAQKIRTEQQ